MPRPDDPTHLLPPTTATTVVQAKPRPTTPETLREDIDATRTRMSRTLDEIEHRIVRRRNELRATATLRPLRSRLTREPWRSVVIAFVAGYIVAAIFD